MGPIIAKSQFAKQFITTQIMTTHLYFAIEHNFDDRFIP